MADFKEFYKKQNEFNLQIRESIEGLEADVKLLNERLIDLQESPGEVTVDDQLLLDDLQQQAENIADALKALDELTPPAIPEE